MEEPSSKELKDSLKATSLFGSIQVFNILISILRNKIVALLIGPIGVGIITLYTSTINLIKSFTDFSLSLSAVREISIAFKSDDSSLFSYKTSVLLKLVWYTGFLGFIICLLGSPLWSKFSFGNYDYTIGFAVLSITLLLSQLQNGKNVILQSTCNFKKLALSGFFGNLIGLLTVIPIYYVLGIDGIVLSLLIISIVSYIIIFVYASKVKFERIRINKVSAYNEGKIMLCQGVMLSLNFMLSSLVFFILRIFINKQGGIEELGIYSASYMIINTYIALVFQSMGQEYYPRLSSLSSEKEKFCNAVNGQIYLSLILLGPLVLLFISFSDQLLLLLYSQKFVRADLLMALSMVGVLFQAPSWCMGYVFLAKSDNKYFLFYETISKLIKLFSDLSFYYFWGLSGLGISMIVSYFYYYLQCKMVCNRRYGLKISKNSQYMLLVYLIISLLLVVVLKYLTVQYRLVISIIVILLSAYFSYIKLNSILDFRALVYNKFFSKHGKASDNSNSQVPR